MPEPLGLLGTFGAARDDALKAAVEVLRSGLCTGGCVAAFAAEGELRAALVRPDGTWGPDVALQPRVCSFAEWSTNYQALR